MKEKKLGTSVHSSTTAQGQAFEQRVADVLRLLGATVTWGISLAHKKVDLLAVFPIKGSPTGHRVLIECKSSELERNQNARVLEMVGLLNLARQLNVADGAEIISATRWGPEAQGAARESGVGLSTYTEKLSQLIDFSPYLKNLVRSYAEWNSPSADPPAKAYHVNSSGVHYKGENGTVVRRVTPYLRRWAERSEITAPIAVLGEFGTGKSILCQRLAYDLARRYLARPGTVRIPLLINLREFTKSVDVETLILRFLANDCQVRDPYFPAFKAMNDAGLLILLLDGFDEMAEFSDSYTVLGNLLEVKKIAFSGGSKALLTSRTEYFFSLAEEERVLSNRGNVLDAAGTPFEILRLVPWDERRIRSFLRRRIPLITTQEPWTFYFELIRNTPSLSDLSSRPLLLEMIARTLPTLVASKEPLNRPVLYEAYLKGELTRLRSVKRHRVLLEDDERFLLLEELACDFYLTGRNAIPSSDAMEIVVRQIGRATQARESFARDFLQASFLARTRDTIRFSHSSIMEYLVAKRLYKEIVSNSPDLFSRRGLHPVVSGFLAEMHLDLSILWDWIEHARNRRFRGAGSIAAGNALTLLCAHDCNALIERDLSEIDFESPKLTLADLSSTKFHNARIRRGDFVNSRLTEHTLSGIVLQDFRCTVYLAGTASELGETQFAASRIAAISALVRGRAAPREGVEVEDARFAEEDGHFVAVAALRIDNRQTLARTLANLRSATWLSSVGFFDEEIDAQIQQLSPALQSRVEAFRRLPSLI